MNRESIFPYDLAFDRNLGWVTEWEQLALRSRRVAIAGMGGVGGIHLLTLARLGIGAFTIADFDTFEYANFNRQIGALISTIGRPKAQVLEQMALDINPELRIRRLDQGVQTDLVDDFLADADLFVDGLDFFEIPVRRHIFAACRKLQIPAITAAPIGTGVGYLVFTPGGMSFDDYFRMEGNPPEEQFLRFLIGLVPRGLHRRYLVDPSRINLAARKGPSTSSAVQLCAGVTAAACLKLLLHRPQVKPAPWHHHFDAYLDRMVTTRLPFGLAGPMQQVKLALARRAIKQGRSAGRIQPSPSDPPDNGRSFLEEVLNLARWAPSGDNAQPWRFQPLDASTVRVHVRHDPKNIYEYDNGEPTMLSAGMLLETMRIAAAQWGRGFEFQLEGPEHLLIRFPTAEGTVPDPLYKVLTLRSVDRRPYRSRPLTARETRALEAALSETLPLRWEADFSRRLAIARLNAAATGIRLRCPEAFAVHQAVIDWERNLSPHAIPARAVGLLPAMLPAFRWGMESWSHMRRLNQAGTFGPALQMDYVPGVRSAAFVIFPGPGPRCDTGRLLAIGQAIQRFWLTTTSLGLAMQPTIAPIAFGRYGDSKRAFSADQRLVSRATDLAQQFRRTLGLAPSEVVFMARVGEPSPRMPNVRSTRLALRDLIIAPQEPVPGDAQQFEDSF